ncbi:hypothetical protein KEM56_001952 [Ascosphaera pollenicola]|nr:hypothetical protein KEM56_001952 [Ascosphaera pollenicola]
MVHPHPVLLTIQKRVPLAAARNIIDWMCREEGDRRAEWIGAAANANANANAKVTAYIWWRRPEEWASVIYEWAEQTGQKKTVLTLYELIEGEETMSQEFHGMDTAVMQKSLSVLVKNGKAQIFGNEDEQGVKFF